MIRFLNKNIQASVGRHSVKQSSATRRIVEELQLGEVRMNTQKRSEDREAQA